MTHTIIAQEYNQHADTFSTTDAAKNASDLNQPYTVNNCYAQNIMLYIYMHQALCTIQYIIPFLLQIQ